MKFKWVTLASFVTMLSCTLQDPVYDDCMSPVVEASHCVVSGLVTDARGQPVAGARITLEDERTTLTDSDGVYSLSLPEPGMYVVSVKAEGFYWQNAVIKAEEVTLQTVSCSFVLHDTEQPAALSLPVEMSVETVQIPIPVQPGTVMTLYSATSTSISEISYSYTLGTTLHVPVEDHPMKEALLAYMEARFGQTTLERQETVPVHIYIPRGIGLKMNATQTVYDVVCTSGDYNISARVYSSAFVSLINYHREDFAGGD